MKSSTKTHDLGDSHAKELVSDCNKSSLMPAISTYPNLLQTIIFVVGVYLLDLCTDFTAGTVPSVKLTVKAPSKRIMQFTIRTIISVSTYVMVSKVCNAYPLFEAKSLVGQRTS